jgi:predicted tellurium resistance membrane protein TerC
MGIIEAISQPAALVSLLTLTFLEIVLGVDNIIFVSIVASKLPPSQQSRGRNIGLFLALIVRIVLLFGLSWIISLEEPFFTLPIINHPTSGKDLILIGGGLFLLTKSVSEIHAKIEGDEHKPQASTSKGGAFGMIVLQILAVNIVFSFDSILTAVGLVNDLQPTEARIPVMVVSVVLSIFAMMAFSGPVSRFIDQHPTFQILALSFLILIGVMLIAEGLGQHINKGYIYFGIFFSIAIEVLNMRMRKKTAIKQSYTLSHDVSGTSDEQGAE